MSITNLPDVVLLHIWQYISPEDIFNMATISPAWERISHEKIPGSKFKDVTLEMSFKKFRMSLRRKCDQKMSLRRIKSYVKFIKEQTPLVANLTCLNFSTIDFLELVSFISEVGLHVTNLVVEGTEFNNPIFIAMKPKFDMCKTLKIRETEYPNEDVLGQLCRSDKTLIRILLYMFNGKIDRAYHSLKSYPTIENGNYPRYIYYSYKVSQSICGGRLLATHEKFSLFL